MSVLYTLWTGSSTAGIGEGNRRVLIVSLSMQSTPSFGSCVFVVLQSFQDSGIKWAAQFSFCYICVCINQDWDLWVFSSE